MSAQDYSVTFPYGATTAPYSPANPHKGDDWAMPIGTAVYVNGTLIGLSGQSGQGVTGPHLHIGHYVNGVAVDPKGQGFNLPAPVTVFDNSNTAADGNYVRLQDGQGTIWLYDHLSNNRVVTKGQTIGGFMSPQEVSEAYANYAGQTVPAGSPPTLSRQPLEFFRGLALANYQTIQNLEKQISTQDVVQYSGPPLFVKKGA